MSRRFFSLFISRNPSVLKNELSWKEHFLRHQVLYSRWDQLRCLLGSQEETVGKGGRRVGPMGPGNDLRLWAGLCWGGRLLSEGSREQLRVRRQASPWGLSLL